MNKKTSEKNTSDSHKNESTVQPTDRLLTFREVHALIGSRCRTSHTARALAARGLIRAVRLNGRVIRFSEASVQALISGGGA